MVKKKITAKPDRLKKIEGRLSNLEKMLQEAIASWSGTNVKRIETRETAIEPWRFLVRRQHPWRKQLYVKGRNLTARQLVGSIKANGFDENKAAENYHLPVEAIREALDYVDKNLDLLAAESEIERLMQKREGGARVPQPVS